MQSTLETESRAEKFARSMETKKDIKELREQLKRILESNDFRGSHRSAQFLKYICEQSVAGHFDSLRERAIGVELFGRSPSYDTGEDAIVRVTASDVRKRLSHYYLSNPESFGLRITLPVGSYVPEFHHDIQEITEAEIVEPATNQAAESPTHSQTKPEESIEAWPKSGKSKMWWMATACLALACINIWLIVGKISEAGSRSASVLPWSVFFADKPAPLLVTSDPNIAEIQGLTGQTVSISDYANQHYIHDTVSLSPEIVHIGLDILRGNKAASVDTPIVAGIAALAAQNGSSINVRGARDLRFSDLDANENLIFLGSPRTDPWTSLFEDQLEFRFVYDNASHQEIIQNARPRSGEPAIYVPTAKGFATGESFATVSFVRNLNRSGNVLILAGANAEGTKVTGELVTHPSRLKGALQRCGLRSSPEGTAQHFQILLHLKMMAGSPTAFDVAACHVLP
jgi:hypothetical protein